MYNQNKFKKLEKRLAKGINGGSFFQLAKEKQAQLARRIQRYANSLKQAVKPAILSAFLALGLSNAAQAQITFIAQTGSSNPFNVSGLGISGYAQPAFVDIDNDGDMDVFIGNSADSIRYFNNNGTSSSPSYTELQGAQNPLLGTFNTYQRIDFVDIDGDGDKDAFIGVNSSGLMYYRNTGTASNPVFSLVTGTGSPVNGITVTNRTRPTFCDLDNDGDFDLILALPTSIKYYRNTGTSTAPTFTLQTGTNDPFDSILGSYSFPSLSFGDIDQDGDFDAVVGFYTGSIGYYQNTGSATSPSFSAQTGASNPLNGVDLGIEAAPDLVDIDNDGDLDLFAGEYFNSTSILNYYKNTTVVSIKEVAAPDALNFFPNPTQGQLYFTEPLEGKLEVYNLMGQLVMEQNLQNTASIDISPLENGTYILKLNSDKEVFVDKIRLER
jgi:hypothetical protein